MFYEKKFPSPRIEPAVRQIIPTTNVVHSEHRVNFYDWIVFALEKYRALRCIADTSIRFDSAKQFDFRVNTMNNEGTNKTCLH